MAEPYAIRKAFRKWYARHYIDILDHVAMIYFGLLMVIAIAAAAEYLGL